MSTIVSDTLLFRSPTCTPLDQMTAKEMADTAGIDIEKFATDMFKSGSNLSERQQKRYFIRTLRNLLPVMLSLVLDRLVLWRQMNYN